ncbi:hypothetical protein PUR29_32960 [Methylobacterium ajmalii]|uniref:Uncharacterized protein n=1 Tax=Methylobacterium ajmalii TaxID=2738439 RepID=A0ABV0A4K2_9HYPH
MTTTTVRMTGAAYWAERGAGAFDALAQEATKTGMDGVAAQLTRDAADCREYLERYGARDSLAGEMLTALKALGPIMADIGYFEGDDPVKKSAGADSLGKQIISERVKAVNAAWALIAKAEGRS